MILVVHLSLPTVLVEADVVVNPLEKILAVSLAQYVSFLADSGNQRCLLREGEVEAGKEMSNLLEKGELVVGRPGGPFVTEAAV